MLADRRRQVLGGPGFGRGEQPGPDPLGPPLQVGEHLPGGGLVPAPGRRLDDDAVAVAVAGEVGVRLVADSFGPVPSGRQGGRPQLPLAVPPAGELLPLADDDFHPRRERSSHGLLEDAAHVSLPLAKLQAEVRGEPVGHVEPEGLVAPDEPHDAGAGHARLPLQGRVRDAALDDRTSDRSPRESGPVHGRPLCELSQRLAEKSSAGSRPCVADGQRPTASRVGSDYLSQSCANGLREPPKIISVTGRVLRHSCVGGRQESFRENSTKSSGSFSGTRCVVPATLPADEASRAQEGADTPSMDLVTLPGTEGRDQLPERKPLGVISKDSLDRGSV